MLDTGMVARWKFTLIHGKNRIEVRLMNGNAQGDAFTFMFFTLAIEMPRQRPEVTARQRVEVLFNTDDIKVFISDISIAQAVHGMAKKYARPIWIKRRALSIDGRSASPSISGNPRTGRDDVRMPRVRDEEMRN